MSIFNIFKRKTKQTVEREMVFLVVFVHEKDDTQVFENYFHKEIINMGHDVNIYGTLTHKILPTLNKHYVNVKVLNIQKLLGGILIDHDLNGRKINND